jgi:polysaccharide biosynthesis transport protein
MNTQLYPVQQPPLPTSPAGIIVEQSEFSRLNARDILNIFVRHLRLIAMVVVAITSLVLLFEFIEGPKYTARADAKIDVLPALGASTVTPQEREMRLETQTRLMSSQALSETVTHDLKLDRSPTFMGSTANVPMTPVNAQRRFALAAAKLHEATEVMRKPQTQLIEVGVTTSSGDLSAKIADYYVGALQRWDDSTRQARRRQSLAVLLPQLRKAQGELAAAEQSLAAARQKYGMLPGAGTEMDLAQINGITNELVTARGLSSGSSARASGVANSGIGGVPLAAQTTSGIASKQHEYDALLQRKAELSVTYGDNYPELRAVNSQIAELSNQLTEETRQARSAAIGAVAANATRDADLARSDASGAAARASTLRGFLNTFVSKAYANTRNNSEVGRLDRDAAAKRSAVQSLEERLELNLNSIGADGIIATLLPPASVPVRPISLSWRSTLTAALIGSFVLGCLIAFAKEMVDNKVRSSAQVRRRFGLRTFGMLPRVDRALLDKPENNPVMQQPRSIFAETARALYNDVICLGDGRSRVVTVTSALPGEGKSTAALTLAAAPVIIGRTSVLVDLDLRRDGVLQDLHRQTGGPDLIDYLSKRSPVGDLRGQFESQRRFYEENRRPNMPAILSVQQPVIDPGALIASAELTELIDELRREFDFVVLNAPPLLAVRDAKVLSRLADQTLMVVRWGKTTIEQLEAAIETLDRPPAGVVFNDVDYREHARRRYSDPIQFVARATGYYDDCASFVQPNPVRRALSNQFTRVRSWFAPASRAGAH